MIVSSRLPFVFVFVSGGHNDGGGAFKCVWFEEVYYNHYRLIV